MQTYPTINIQVDFEDISQAKSFYGNLRQWKPDDMQFDDTYACVAFASDVANIAQNGVCLETQVDDDIVYFYTDDLDGDMARVRELGGRILLERLDIIGFGAIGMFLDPMGNQVAFWQSTRLS